MWGSSRKTTVGDLHYLYLLRAGTEQPWPGLNPWTMTSCGPHSWEHLFKTTLLLSPTGKSWQKGPWHPPTPLPRPGVVVTLQEALRPACAPP